MVAAARDRASNLELFFDLVFVFTITQVALVVEHHPSWTAAAQAALELSVVFWMYGGFSWLTNAFGSAGTRQRTVLLVGMAAFFVVSLAVPRAFDDDGVAFGIAYLVLNLVHLGGFLSQRGATFAAMVVIGRWNLLAAVLIIVAGVVGAPAHWPLWVLAVAVQWLPQVLGRHVGTFDIGVEHFAERHGLMIIIVLGESLVSVALAAGELPVDARLVIGALCGLAASAALWWAYFGGDDEAAADALRAAPAQRRARLALIGFDLPTVLMLAGVVALSAGTRLSLPELTHATSLAAASFIGGGAATYLVGLALQRVVLRSASPLPRLAGAAVLVGTIPIGAGAGAAQQSAAVAAVIILMLVAEGRAAGRGATRPSPAERTPRSGRMAAMTQPSDPRAVAEYKVPAVDLKVGDIVDTGDQDWQQVVGVYQHGAGTSDDKIRKAVDSLGGRYVLAQLTDIVPVDGGVYFAAGLAMVTGDDETADRTIAEVVSTEDGVRTYLYTKFELVTIRGTRG